MPGLLVVLNPNDEEVVANFTASKIIASELSVLMLSDSLNDTPLKGKFSKEKLQLAKHSVSVFTFVPK